MNRYFLAVVLTLTFSASCVYAAATPESSAASAAADFQLPALPRFKPAARAATIQGGMNHSPVDLTFDRAAGTIKGGINLSPADVKIEADKITGGANLSPIDLTFSFGADQSSIEGGANQSPVKYDIDWQNGTLDGYANHSPLHLDFDLQAGTAKGYANHSPIELKFDAASGKLTGGMNFSPVDVALVDFGLRDFLNYFFLFLNQP